MFFALSGFLVAGSLERCKTVTAFIGLRMIRIFPALAVEVTLSALILGPLLSSFGIRAYLLNPEFRRYFLNAVGEIHFFLPGVFTNAPSGDIVNGQLWTIPYELACYLSLVVLVFLGLRQNRRMALALTIGSTILFFFRTGLAHHWNAGNFTLGGVGFRHGAYLVWSFLWGVIIYLYRDRLRWNIVTLAVALIIAAVTVSLNGIANVLLPPAFALLTVMIGLSDFRRVWILRGADYSYGIYLYHWIIFQSVLNFFPHKWYWTIGVGLPLVVLFSAFSWHVIEKPAMKMRLPIMRDDKVRSGPALVACTALAAALMGFVLSYELFPIFNPTSEVSHPAKPVLIQ